jgi:Glycosyl transferases group 1
MTLKVLYLPIGRQPGTEDAFRNAGADLRVYDFWSHWERTKNREAINNEFMTHVRQFQPNLIHMQLQFTGMLNSQILDEARKACPGVIITNWSGDCRAQAMQDFTRVAGAVDLSLISSTGQLEMYEKAGCKNVKYWQIGYDPKVNYPLNYTEFQYDAVFLGNNYGSQFPDGHLRTGAVAFCQSNLPRFKVYGTGYGGGISALDIRQCNEVYNKSICPVSISNFNSVAHYFSDRLLHCVASGRPVISWYFPGAESYFVEGSEILFARSNKDIVDAVNYCKSNLDVAKQIGINGHRRVAKEHTFTSRIVELLHMTNLAHLV